MSQFVHQGADKSQMDRLLRVVPKEKRYFLWFTAEGLLNQVKKGKETWQSCVKWGHPDFIQDFAALHEEWRKEQKPTDADGNWHFAVQVPGAQLLRAARSVVTAALAVRNAKNAIVDVVRGMHLTAPVIPEDKKVAAESAAIYRAYGGIVERLKGLLPTSLFKTIQGVQDALMDVPLPKDDPDVMFWAAVGDLKAVETMIKDRLDKGAFTTVSLPASADVPEEEDGDSEEQLVTAREMAEKASADQAPSALETVRAMWAARESDEAFVSTLPDRLSKDSLLRAAAEIGVDSSKSMTKPELAAAIANGLGLVDALRTKP